jgi:hypothetical protein
LQTFTKCVVPLFCIKTTSVEIFILMNIMFPNVILCILFILLGTNCGSDDWESFILCPWSESWERFLVHLPRWHNKALDVPWVPCIERIGEYSQLRGLRYCQPYIRNGNIHFYWHFYNISLFLFSILDSWKVMSYSVQPLQSVGQIKKHEVDKGPKQSLGLSSVNYKYIVWLIFHLYVYFTYQHLWKP